MVQRVATTAQNITRRAGEGVIRAGAEVEAGVGGAEVEAGVGGAEAEAGVGVEAGVEGAEGGEAEAGAEVVAGGGAAREAGAEVEGGEGVGDMILTEGTQIATMIKTCICVRHPRGT